MITDVLPIDVTIASPLAGNDLLLCALFGGLISGVGSGLTIRFGGAIDGIIVTYFAALKTIDFIVEGIDRSKGVMIITEKPDDITDALTVAFETGATIMPATGGYSKAEKAVVYFIVNRFQIARMRTIVHEIDPKAFMTITEVADVFTSM